MECEFLPFTQAARQARVSTLTLRRRVADVGIQTFCDPLDRRLRLIRAVDLNDLRTPRPIEARQGTRLPTA